MNIKSLFTLTALISVVAVIGIAFVFLPERIWSASSIAALILFGLAAGFTIYSPFSLPSDGRGGDTVRMASLGSMGVIVLGLLGWSGLTFIVALTGLQAIAWGMIVIAVAGFLISNIIVHATAKIVDHAAAETDGPNIRTEWRGQLEALMSTTVDVNVRASLGKLIEKVQFAASDISSTGITVNDQITAAIATAKEHSTSNSHDTEQFQSLIAKVAILLEQREAQLKVQRSKV